MNEKNGKTKVYIAWIAFTEAVGALAGWITKDGMRLYDRFVEKPPLSPPNSWFPIVWIVLYALMGIGAARIYMSKDSPVRTRSLIIYIVQLAFNFAWSIVFFNLQIFGFALIWLLILWLMIIIMIVCFAKVDRPAALMQVPYLLWVTFAAYLNWGVYILN